jgi:hypothetical protein
LTLEQPENIARSKEMPKDDPFELTGEAIGYISLDQALLKSIEIANRDQERYKERLAWTEKGSEHREDSYMVQLWFWNPDFRSQPTEMSSWNDNAGIEEFVFNHLGELQNRQTLVWPTPQTTEGAIPPLLPPMPAPSGELTQVAPAIETSTPLTRLRRVFGVTREASQYYMDMFVLEPDEWVKLDVPFTVPVGSVFGFRKNSEGRCGITSHRILFAANAKFDWCFSNAARSRAYGFGSRTIRGRYGTICRGKHGPTGIEIESRWPSVRHTSTAWQVYLKSPEYRDILVRYIQSEFDGTP